MALQYLKIGYPQPPIVYHHFSHLKCAISRGSFLAFLDPLKKKTVGPFHSSTGIAHLPGAMKA